MVATCSRLFLKDAFGLVERFTGKNINLPIINNILIKAKNQQLTLQSTNLEVGAEIIIPAKVSKEGSLTIPPRILTSILQTISDEKVILKEKNNILYIETESTISEIRG